MSSRREFLGDTLPTLAFAAIASTLPGCAGNIPAAQLQSVLMRIQGTAPIGKAYLQAVADEAHIPVLEAAFLSTDHRSVLTHIRDLINQDYLDDRLIIVEGWLMSRTEARLAALSYLCFS
ncbi:MAG: hypothetical protein QY326_01955 [Bdellovibrionota bacterium]|nr:MAG: hypothetical protein QY326_01955 [Bdellovibrionota bacterium]